MELRLMYEYLERIKEFNQKFNKQKKKSKIVSLILGIILLASLICIGYLIYYSIHPLDSNHVLYALIGEFATLIALYIFSWQHSIKNSSMALERYRNQLKTVKEWLADEGFEGKEKIADLKQGVNEYINEYRTEKKERDARVDKWLEIFFIPIVLAIIAEMIKNGDTHESVLAISSIVLISAALYGVFAVFEWLIRSLARKQFEGMVSFSADLNSILLYIDENKTNAD